MKKIISAILSIALLVGTVTVNTNVTAEAEASAQYTKQMINVAGVETGTVESPAVETSVPTEAPAQPTIAPTQAPVFTGNVTVNDENVFVTTENGDKTCTITGYTGNTAVTTLYIPSKIKDKTVSSVSAGTLASCYFLKNLVVKGDADISAGVFHPEAKPEIWAKASSKAAAYAPTVGLAVHAIDGSTSFSGKKSGDLRKVTLTWSAVSGAVSYNIYRKRGKQEYALYTNVAATTYTNGKLKVGAKYTYKVAPVFQASNGETINGISCKEKAFSLTPAKPKKVKAKGVRGGVQVRWKRNKNVTGYQVYMKVHVKGFKTKFNRVKTIKKNKITGYRCKMLVRGMKYSYRVRTYKTIKGKKIFSPFVTVTTKAK